MSKVKQNLTLKIQMLAEKVWDKGTKEFFEGIYKNLTSLIKQPNTIYLQIKKLSIANITRGIKTDTRKRDKLT